MSYNTDHANSSGMDICKFPNEYNEEQKALLIQLKMTQINIADVEKALKEMERLDEGYQVCLKINNYFVKKCLKFQKFQTLKSGTFQSWENNGSMVNSQCKVFTDL